MVRHHFNVRASLTVTLSVVGVKSSPVCANAYMLTQGGATMVVDVDRFFVFNFIG